MFNEMIDIKKFDKAEVLCALYNNSRQQGLGVFQNKQTLTKEKARELLKDNPYSYFDYLFGVVMKVDLSGDELDPRLYDRDNGIGAAERALSGLKEIEEVLNVETKNKSQG